MRRLALLLSLTFTLACAAHEKAGDRAAATGDWKTAERQYAEALRREPESQELRQKHAAARAEAIGSAMRRARACGDAQDFECAYAESSYAMGLDDASPEIAAFQRSAARLAAYARVRRAEEATQRQDYRNAFALLASARQASPDPGVADEARLVEPRLVKGAVSEAERLRAGRDYPGAVELLALAAGLDGAVRPRLDAVRAEQEAWLDAEHARLAADGDRLLDDGRFADAQAAYAEALRFRKSARTEALSRYAGHLVAGERATQARDFDAAAHCYREAARTGVDRNELAATMLARVEVRPYEIAIGALEVRPGWKDVRRLFTGRVRDQPSLGLEIDLPDGRSLQSGTRRALRLPLDARFVVLSNAYDDRTVTFRAIHADGARRAEIGLVVVPLAELVERGSVTLRDEVIEALRVRVAPTAEPEGSFAGLAPLAEDSNRATAWSMPGPGTRGYRLVSVDAAAAAADVREAPGDPAPDLYVELEQRGAVVYRSPAVLDRAAAAWSPQATYVFTGAHEDLTVRVWDEDAQGRDPVLAATVPARALEAGRFEFATPAGSRVRLGLAPRAAGPDTRPVTHARR